MTNLYPLNFKRGNRLRLMKQIRYYQPKKIASEKVSIWGVCVWETQFKDISEKYKLYQM